MYYGLQKYSISDPIASNFAFSQWANYGLSVFKDVYIDYVFASFQQLSDTFLLPRIFFPCICRFAVLSVICTPTPIDLILEPMCIGKGMISVFYDKICSLHNSLTSIKTLNLRRTVGKHFIQGAFLICVCQTRLDPIQNTSSYSLD